ncbi:MAG: PA0069 family radical SAM protein [Microscillaceae bacterium]|nr:PA0069 family radical SAM protein [Microscillaceae bacterium]
MENDYLKGRGAQINPQNPFHKNHFVQEHWEGIDEPELEDAPQTQIFYETPKKILSTNNSTDIPFTYSINPYQGCEHGCIYCYARETHEYWGLSAGRDFETKIIVKKNAPQLLEKQFLHKNWKSTPVMLSGNTDCYQPLEKKLKITREILKVFAKYANPVSIISKNALIVRDLDILRDLAADNLVHVYISITSQEESLRRLLEPRTATYSKKLQVIEQLSQAGVPVGVMIAPIIPGLNNHEIFHIMQSVAERGARSAGYTVVRLNGSIAPVFKDWLEKNFPDRAQKVWNQIKALHGGQIDDKSWGRRMSGDGAIAQNIQQMFRLARKKFMGEAKLPPYDLNKFRKNGNLNLFEF